MDEAVGLLSRYCWRTVYMNIDFCQVLVIHKNNYIGLFLKYIATKPRN